MHGPAGAHAQHQASPGSECTLSPLDTRRFGLLVARNPRLTCADLAATNAFCDQHHVELLIARCPTHDTPTVHCLEGDGFRWMDTLVYWRRSLVKQAVPAREQSGERGIRVLHGADAPHVALLARAAFTNYDGHYHADSRLDRRACTDVYVDWAINCCAQPGFADAVIGVESDDGILGFMALKGLGEGTCDISLVAVAPSAQGRGLFRALLTEALHWMTEHGYTVAEYSCILTNIAAQTGLARLGFALDRSIHTFHKWFDVHPPHQGAQPRASI